MSTRSALGARCRRAADAADHRERAGVRNSSRRSQAEEAQGRRPAGDGVRRRQRALDAKSSSTTRPRSSTSFASTWTSGAHLPNPNRLAGHAGNGAAASALAASQVQRHSAILLPGRGRRNRDLADRGRAASREDGKRFLEHLANANNDANPELMRLALKLATGAGKTTVMAMLIAWQTINAVRRRAARISRAAFWSVAPGLTIKDRLRVLQPNDPDSYYAKPRTRSQRHAGRCEPGQDRHHQLSRLQAARAHRTLQGRPLAAPRPTAKN